MTGVQTCALPICFPVTIVEVVNRMLVVSGSVEEVKAFSITGAVVDVQKALNPGIYIVKVGTETFKVNVR